MGSTKARRSSAAVRGCRASSKGVNFLLMLVARREGSLGLLGRKLERGGTLTGALVALWERQIRLHMVR